MSIFDDLGAEQERLEKILNGLDEAQWCSPGGSGPGRRRWPRCGPPTRTTGPTALRLIRTYAA